MVTVKETYDYIKSKSETLPLEGIWLALSSSMTILCTVCTLIFLLNDNTESLWWYTMYSIQCSPYHRLLNLTCMYAKISTFSKASPSDSKSFQRSSYTQWGPYKFVFLLFLLLPPYQGAGKHPAAATFSANTPSLLSIWHLPRAWNFQLLAFMHWLKTSAQGWGRDNGGATFSLQ